MARGRESGEYADQLREQREGHKAIVEEWTTKLAEHLSSHAEVSVESNRAHAQAMEECRSNHASVVAELEKKLREFAEPLRLRAAHGAKEHLQGLPSSELYNPVWNGGIK